ncbi:hypothetical protein MADA3029_1080032 [Vibrio nigripulchritudo MADA3029]|nr:hypothetical protein MADA3029_1080032 [Vibrio nigripulchritudo MADA3029]
MSAIDIFKITQLTLGHFYNNLVNTNEN